MRAVIHAPIPLLASIKKVDFLPIRRREHLLIPNPYGRHPKLLPILANVDDPAFLAADINPHYVPSTTKVT